MGKFCDKAESEVHVEGDPCVRLTTYMIVLLLIMVIDLLMMKMMLLWSLKLSNWLNKI